MTVIIAASVAGETWIGSDTLASDAWGVSFGCGPKVWEWPGGWAGFAGTFGQRTAAREALAGLTRLQTPSDERELTRALRAALKDEGWKGEGDTKLPRNEDVRLLVATRQGRLYEVWSELVPLRVRGVCAVGSGYQVAMGAAYAARALRGEERGCAEAMVRLGVRAAGAIITTCGGGPVVRRVR